MNFDNEKSVVRAERLLERARCEAIMTSPAAAISPGSAAHLAFNTAMPSDEAIKLLSMSVRGAGGGVSLGQRMSNVHLPNPGSGDWGASQTPAAATAAGIVSAGEKRRGEFKGASPEATSRAR